MTQEEIAKIFNKAYNGQRNFLTTYIVTYGSVPGFIYEISSGKGFKRETIYGVTILTERGERTEHNEGGFTSLADAKYYAEHFYKSEVV